MSRDHRKLRAFELADDLVIEIYTATKTFPNDERYGLVSQMRRSAVSVAANIVEGCARQTEKDYLHFLNIAFSSLRELGYYIDLSRRLEYIKPDLAKALDDYQSETARVMAALIRALKINPDSIVASSSQPPSLQAYRPTPMPIKATDLKPGKALMYEGHLQIILSTEHVKPGKGPAYVQAKMKNIDTGTIKINRINSSDKLEDVNIDKRTMQFLYDSSGKGSGPFVFMDNETYDQLEIDGEIIPKQQSQWLKENIDVTVVMFDGRTLSVELPASVELKITETTPQPKGATATNQLKEATVETGARVRVPPFIGEGQMVKINTETGEYQGKA